MRTKVIGSLLLILVVFLTACGGATRDESGAITEEGELDVFSLTVGDCFSTDATDEVSDVGGVPCSEPHDSEVFALVNYDADSSAEWPGDDAINTFSDEACTAEFEGFIGLPYAESRYYISYLQPTEESWANGDREVVCLVVGEDDEKITGSLRGVAE
jgi:hypothetical protein